jgi:hypothetical protein
MSTHLMHSARLKLLFKFPAFAEYTLHLIQAPECHMPAMTQRSAGISAHF